MPNIKAAKTMLLLIRSLLTKIHDKYMKLEVLSIHHTKQLLAFELENQAWFESLIASRDSSFYTEKGVEDHVESLNNAMKRKGAYSLVLVDNNMIIARANLKEITEKSATVGYRVAKNAISQGIASFCLSELIAIAKNKYNLGYVKAHVLENNPASIRVLQKHGFEVISVTPNFLTLNGKTLSCTEFRLHLQ